MWNLKAANHEPILTSETYNSKARPRVGSNPARRIHPHDNRYERKTATDRSPYFVLKAANGEPIGRSEMYSSTAAMEGGITSCKNNGPSATTDDKT